MADIVAAFCKWVAVFLALLLVECIESIMLQHLTTKTLPDKT